MTSIRHPVWSEPTAWRFHRRFTTKAVVRAAAGRPFIWVDDVIGPVDRWWIEVEHPGPALLHQVDPAIGLTVPDIAGIEAWLREAGS